MCFEIQGFSEIILVGGITVKSPYDEECMSTVAGLREAAWIEGIDIMLSIYIYIYAYIHTYIHTYIQRERDGYIHYIYIYIYIYTHYTYVYIYIYIHVLMLIVMYCFSLRESKACVGCLHFGQRAQRDVEQLLRLLDWMSPSAVGTVRATIEQDDVYPMCMS